MRKSRGIAMGVVAWGLLGGGVLSSQNLDPPKKVGRVVIESSDIFDNTKKAESGWLFRAANVLHLQTNENVIRRELLFHEGDPYRPEYIEETARNLRQFKFLRRAWVESNEGENGEVDLLVRTRDTWTLEPQLNFSRVGNQSSSKWGVVERNFLGTGKRVAAFVHHKPSGTYNSLAYKDQQFLGRHLDLTADYLRGVNFREYGASFSRPFRSSRSQSSFELSNFLSQKEVPTYREGVEVGRFEKVGRQASFLLGRSFGSSAKLIRHGTLAYRHETKTYRPVVGDTLDLLKPALNLSLIEIGARVEQVDYIKEKHIEKFDRDEDFNVGAGLGFSLAVGQNWNRGRRTELLPQMTGQWGHSFRPGHFALFSGAYRSRIANDKTDNLLASMQLQYFNRLGTNNTLASQLSYDHGYRLDPEDFLLLGEDSGLRGYSVGQFSGERRLLFNLEDRLYFAEDLFHLISLGGAIFFDSGYSWDRNNTMGLSDFRSSVGLGFRLAMSRSSRNEPIRFDLGYALNDNKQSSRLVFSIRSGLKFGGIEEEAQRK